MSVLVNGMKMPKYGCRDCIFVNFNWYGDVCPILKKEVTENIARCGFHPDCPLVEVPPPCEMDEEVVFVKQKAVGELILNSLFSEETEKFYNNCALTSQRMAFMQGMNYAGLLCSAKLEQYPAIIRHELPKEET